MSSAHEPAHHHHHHPATTGRRLWLATALTLAYAGVEAGVGWWAGSLALVADAGHMVNDAAALALAAIAAWLAGRPASARHSYGFGRAELLAALVNSLALLILVAWIAVSAVQRLREPQAVIGEAVSVAAAAGLAINLLVAWLLSRGERNLNVRAALLHVMGDLLGSVAGLKKQQALYAVTVQRLANPAEATVILVSRPETSALREAERTRGELAELGIQHLQLAINGVFTTDRQEDAIAVAMARRAALALAEMPTALVNLPSTTIPFLLKGTVGLDALRSMAATEPAPRLETTAHLQETALPPGLAALVEDLSQTGHGVLMTMGKRGGGARRGAGATRPSRDLVHHRSSSYELPVIARVQQNLAVRCALIPWLAEVPVGPADLTNVVR